MSILADVLVFLALVDVLQNNGHAIRSVTLAAGAELIVLGRTDPRALLATVAPGGADAAATGCLRHRRRHLEDALRFAGAVFVAGEAQRLASVCVCTIRSAARAEKKSKR